MAVDVTDVDDTPAPERGHGPAAGRGGEMMDSSVICHPAMVALLEDTAREDIPRPAGHHAGEGTDMRAIH